MKRILITRPRLQAESFASDLKGAGFEPVFFPVIDIQPVMEHRRLDVALQNLDRYAWVVFSSANAVDIVLDRLPCDPRKDGATLPPCAAIGPKTAGALRQRGLIPDFVPQEFVMEAILPGLGDISGKWVLLPSAEIAREVLPEGIAAAGGIPHQIAVYRTLPVAPDAEGLKAVRFGLDFITFTSPSTVENFFALMRLNALDPLDLPGNPRFACIGPVTAAAAREAGIPDPFIADEYTTRGLIDLITNIQA